ncbi:MAG TPA: ribosome small subunit-dependent GTPase A, partial [Calditrichaeota bacterium]|nr:ribosome small subunit-dependent GTPase A [Calditrichota bacterium]
KKQQKQIQYFLREKAERKHKQQILHDDRIPKFLERHLPFVRRMTRNLDQLVIVSSFASPPLKTGLIDRFLVLTELENLHAVVCLNKSDLAGSRKEVEKIAKIYADIGYDTAVTSAKKKEGIDALYTLLKNKRSAFAGHSGVGKSSLLNAINPELRIQVEEVSTTTNKGRHTTTKIRIYTLDKHTEVLDLPGIKILDFIDIHYTEARFYYPEFEEYAEYCKFRDCIHLSETDCAVKNAVEEGKISVLRYNSYCNFIESLK